MPCLCALVPRDRGVPTIIYMIGMKAGKGAKAGHKGCKGSLN